MREKLLKILKENGNVAINKDSVGDDDGKSLLKEIKNATGLNCRIKITNHIDNYGRTEKGYVVEVV